MSFSSDFTITTLSESLSQQTLDSSYSSSLAPFRFGGNYGAQTLRDRNTPYLAGIGGVPSVSTGSIVSPGGSGGGGGGVSYISPFAYYDFETSGSQFVTNVLGTNNYTGSFVGTVGPDSSTSFFGFSNTFVFSGSFAMRFPQEFNERYVNLGTPAERTNWSTAFSGSFSVSMWIYLEWNSGNSYRYSNTRFFSHKINASGLGFAFGTNQGKPMFYSYGGVGGGGTVSQFTNWGNASSTNFEGWNHFVFVVDGDTDATNRRVKAYINNNDFGFADDSTSGRYFQKSFLDNQDVAWGATGVGSGNAKFAMDEASIWNIALSAEQVNALYNGGSGANALIALTSSS